MLTSLIRTLAAVAPRIPVLSKQRLNFITLHYIYIISWALVASLIIYTGGNIRYIDALFLACNAATQGGLNTVDLSLLHGYQQTVLWFVSILTNMILIHSLLVFYRLSWYEKRPSCMVEDAVSGRLRSRSETVITTSGHHDGEGAQTGISKDIQMTQKIQGISNEQNLAIDEAELGLGTEISPLLQPATLRMSSDTCQDKRVSIPLLSWEHWRWIADKLRSGNRHQGKESSPYLKPNTAVSGVSDLSDTKCIEHRALMTLFAILVSYYLLSHLFGIILLKSWINSDTKHGSIVEASGVNRTWWSVFTATSAFQNLGLTLTPDSMTSFRDAAFPISVMTFLIIVGNTGFPCMLRFIIWSLSKITSQRSLLREELQFLLDYPRRCFTLLFPSRTTWWFFGILILLNGLDMILFILLDVGYHPLLGSP